MKNYLRLTLALLLTGMIAASPAIAEGEKNKADMWVVTVKNGHASEFEEAFKAHMEMRKEKEDPRSWNVYNAVTGSDLNNYYIRYCCVSWADMDAYRDWSQESGLGKHWNDTVDPHVKRYEHVFSSMDAENSNMPGEDDKVGYVGVTSWELKPGHGASFEAAKKQLSDAAKAGGWPRKWVWGSAVSGSNSVYVATLYENYASMEQPETGFRDMLVKQLGSEEAADEALNKFSSNFNGSDYTIYALREDLSMGGDED